MISPLPPSRSDSIGRRTSTERRATSGSPISSEATPNHQLASADKNSSRREFLRWSGKLAVSSSLVGVAIPHVHAAEDNTIRLALVGCGGRGGGAVGDAMRAPGGPVKLVAMADLLENRLTGCHKALTKRFGDRIDVPTERRFVGFDAYRNAIDCLRPGDIAMLTGYTVWRPVHLDYAVDKGVHVFMEKPFAADSVGCRRVIQAGERAKQKNLKIAAGLMCRHSQARQELIQRIRDEQLGQIQLIRAYRMEPVWPLEPRAANENELLWQIRNRIHFLWLSGSLFGEHMIHQVDEVCWIKDAWPTTAHGIAGRIPNNVDCGQNLDAYSVEYTFADGTKADVVARHLPNCHNAFATYVHGAKCAAQFSGNIHAATVHTYKDQRIARDQIVWRAAKEPCSPWQAEWNVLLDAIRNDRPHNEAERAAYANLAFNLGRAAAHTGKVVTWDEALASNFEYFSGIDELDENSPAPVQADAQGRYPAPVPGNCTDI